jgi:SAM-dependent methyltransferase
MAEDPYAHLKDGAWRELAEIDRRLEQGEIDEDGWHEEVGALVVPAYLAATTPWEQSGKSGDRADWEHARSLIADAIDRDGTFLDVGCANGYLMESVVRWSPYAVEPYGLDIAPELAALARRRLPNWSERIYVGNALAWDPPRPFDYVRTNLDYVPAARRGALAERLLSYAGRLIIGVFNEHETERTTEESLRSCGFEAAGGATRRHRRKAGMEYRVLWLDGAERRGAARN